MQSLTVAIGAPADPMAVPRDCYTVMVECAHAHTRLVWNRQCRHGCHRMKSGTRARCPIQRDGRCTAVFPFDEMLIQLGITAHTCKTTCHCAAHFWMVHGPMHHVVAGRPQISGKSGGHQLSAEDHTRLRASLAHHLGDPR